jgi:hypothetical protein
MYTDIFTSIYDHYSVVRATAKVTWVNTATVPFFVGMLTDDDSSTSVYLNALCEQTHGVHKLIPAQSGSLSTWSSTINWDCKKILNIDPFTSELYKTSVSANPAEDSNLTLWALSADTSAVSVYFDIEIVYEVLWTELATPPLS